MESQTEIKYLKIEVVKTKSCDKYTLIWIPAPLNLAIYHFKSYGRLLKKLFFRYSCSILVRWCNFNLKASNLEK
jgi:hypothetical protein